MMMDIQKAILIVINLPFFWNTMSWATIIAMFTAATIYDGNVPHAKKGVFSVASYIFLLFLTISTYIFNRYPVVKSEVAYQLFIYPVELVFLSLFWFIGFVSGIGLFRYLHRKNH